MASGVVRVRDRVLCTVGCDDCDPFCPHGRVLKGSEDTKVEGRGVARVGDLTSNCCGCCCPCPNKIITGSEKTFVNGKAVATSRSKVTRGKIIQYSETTFVE